jgi:hypothetical protein
MISAKYTPLVFAFFMSMMMAFIMSAILTFVNLGAVPDFISRWLHAFAVAWACAFPTVLLVAPIARKIVAKIVQPAQITEKK